MTKRITVTLPDEVAATLEHLPNVSAYVTEAIVRRQRASHLRAELEARGIPVTDEGLARMPRSRPTSGAPTANISTTTSSSPCRCSRRGDTGPPGCATPTTSASPNARLARTPSPAATVRGCLGRQVSPSDCIDELMSQP